MRKNKKRKDEIKGVKDGGDTNNTECGSKHRKTVSIICLIIFLVFSGLVAWFIGKPMIRFVDNPEQFRNWVSNNGMWSWLVCIGMMVLQIIVAIIPGGALEVGAGYAFGPAEASVLCIIGSIIGCAIVFQFVRMFGVKLVESFFSLKKVRSLKFLHDERKRNIIVFIIFLVPGTPKDLLSYFMGLTDMKLSTWLVISTLARTPAIIVSAMGGNALGTKNYVTAVIVFTITTVVSIVGMLCYKKMCKVHDNHTGKTNN